MFPINLEQTNINDSQEIGKVFNNDYVMTQILRYLDLRQQYELQKICRRLRFLVVTCVWRRDCKDVQMNRSQMGNLTDDEFFELLLLNADNTHTLTIDATDRWNFQMYFASCYENLLELRIKRFQLHDRDFLTIVNNCAQIQLLDYNEGRDEKQKPAKEVQSLEILWKLKHLRALLLQNLVQSISYGDICLLANKVPLERLELCNVRTCAAECDLETVSLMISTLKILKMDCRSFTCHSHDKCLEFVKKCSNLQELQFNLANGANGHLFNTFENMETINLGNCSSQSIMWNIIIRNIRIKHLEIDFYPDEDELFQISEDIPGICVNLECLKVTNDCPHGAAHFWWNRFKSPSTSFENLQELTLTNQNMCDEFMGSVSEQCHQLKALHLSHCKISGMYINNLTNLRRLTILDNRYSIPWSNLYAVLQDILLLQYLELEGEALYRDNFTRPTNIEHLANSLEILKLHGPEDIRSFWEYILPYCEHSFQKLHTLHLLEFGLNAEGDIRFYTLFKELHKLQLESSEVLDGEDFIEYDVYSNDDDDDNNDDDIEHMMPTFTHLVYMDCFDLYWSSLIDILKYSKVEIFEIFDMSLENWFGEEYLSYNSNPLAADVDIFKHIRKLTITYNIFQVNCRFWRRFLENCPTFQLCCAGHNKQDDVLQSLFENSQALERVTAIYANEDLYSVKSYIAENNSSLQIPVYLLDAENKSLWNTGYAKNKCVIIIET